MKSGKLARRSLLTMAAGAVAGNAATHAIAIAKAGVRFGVRSPLPKVGLRERALLVKRIGFDGIELGAEWLDRPVEDIQKDLDGTSVVVSAIVGSIALLDT